MARLGCDPASTGAEESFGRLVRDSHRAFSCALQARIADHGVTIGQWYFLRALWEEDGLTQRELSRRVGMREPTTVSALNSMERDGLIRRTRNAHDRRKINVFLTGKGQNLKNRLLPLAVEIDARAMAGIPATDIRAARRVLERITTNLEAIRAGG